MADRRTGDTEDCAPQLVTSDLGEMTQRGLGLIHAASTRTILLSKGMQWRAVASSLFVYGALILLANFLSHGEQFMMVFKIPSIALAMAATFMVVRFEFW